MEKSEKVGEFYIPKSGKNEMVRESQGKSIQCTRVQMLTKMQKKILNRFTQTAYNSWEFNLHLHF